MADEFNVALDIPYVFELTINDLGALWRKLESQSFALTARSPLWYGRLEGEFNVTFGTLEAYIGEATALVPAHGMEKTAAEAVMATILMRRIGVALRELSLEATQVLVAGDGSDDAKGRLRYDENNRISGVDSDYLASVLDLSADYNGDGCVFEVLSYSLNSPFSVKSMVASLMLSFNVATAPLSGAHVNYDLILNAISTAIEVGNLGCTLLCTKKSDDRLSMFVKEEFQKLKAHAAGADVRLIQRYLKDLGFYFGKVDNIFGPESKLAAENFARVYKVYDYAQYSDSEFLYMLANVHVRYRGILPSTPR